jgi:sec-independent protein translocase protein TatA
MPFIGNLGAPELIIILVIALLVLGPGKLPEVGSALGKGIREFRKAATDVKEAANIDVAPQAGPATPAASTAPAPATRADSAPPATPGPETPAS